jgi:ligand-binding sensor domain-containing protein
VLAGTGHGIYRLQGEVWSRVDDVALVEDVHERSVVRRGGAPMHERWFDADINAIARSGDTLYAATSEGMLRSVTAGERWKIVSALDKHGWNFVAASRAMVVAATLRSAMLSMDGGQKWTPVKLPATLEQLAAVAVDGAGGLWVGGREGVFFSEDGGGSWQTLKAVSIRDVNSLFYDEPTQRMLITAKSKNTIAFAVHLPDETVRYWNTGWNMKLVRAVGDHLVGATMFDGMVVQPQMVDSSEVASH